MRKLLRPLIFLMALIGSFFIIHPVSAAITGAAGFSVEPEDSQGAAQSDYFLLNVESGKSYPLNLKITNSKKYPIDVVVKPTVAGTTNQGQINYANVTSVRDSSLKYDWTKMGPVKQKVTIPAKGSQTVSETINVKAPKFNGVLLGSFYIYSPTINHKMHHKKSKGMSLTNNYSYSVSTLFKVGNVDKVQPDLRLVRVRPTLLGIQPAVNINLQNFEPKYITNNDMRVKAKIYPAKSNKLLFQNSQKQMNFAPNSNFNFPVSWGNKPMKAGNYQARVRINTSGKSWYFKKNFTISPADANRLNRNNPNTKRNYWPLIITIIVIVLLLIGVLFYWFYKRGQNQATK